MVSMIVPVWAIAHAGDERHSGRDEHAHDHDNGNRGCDDDDDDDGDDDGDHDDDDDDDGADGGKDEHDNGLAVGCCWGLLGAAGAAAAAVLLVSLMLLVPLVLLVLIQLMMLMVLMVHGTLNEIHTLCFSFCTMMSTRVNVTKSYSSNYTCLC